MKWKSLTSIIMLVFALAFAAPSAYTDPGGGGARINPADDYCNQTYTSPYDGTPQPPIGCPQP